MKRFSLVLAFITVGLNSVLAQGTIVEDTIVLQLDYQAIDDIIQQNGIPTGLLSIDYDVEVHRVVYETPDVDGITTTTASGLVMIPVQDSCAMPMMAYLHGTKALKEETFYYLNGEWQLGVISAASGYAMVMPDYLGLGMSPGIHPYQHAESQATASIDIMRVCRTICENENRPLNDQLFIMGYSQGGHAVMATHRKIQEELGNEFTVTASAPGSGPYDLSGSQLDMVASFDPYSEPGYLPFLIQSYQHVYGNLYDSIQQIYVPPYDETLPPLLDGSVGMWEINQAMPAVPRDIIQPAYADMFFSDTLHPAYLALKANDVYEWIPEAPVLFNYCRSDEQVTYLNTLVAADYMTNAGAPSIEVVERDSVLGHFQCAQPAILFSKLWFDGMANFCGEDNTSVDDSKDKTRISVYPNPNADRVVNFDNPVPISVRITDLLGRQLLPATKVKTNGVIDISGLKPGIVLVEMYLNDEMSTQRLVIQ